jgi:hypothetical protein
MVVGEWWRGMSELQGFIEVSEVLRSGVYALLLKGEVVYVGKSKCMLSRIEAHRGLFRRRAPSWMPIKGVQFDQAYVRPCPVAMLDALELEMINLYKPKLNERLKNNEKVKLEINALVAQMSGIAPPQPTVERRL